MSPYLSVSEDELTYIKETFDEADVRESLALIAMEYPLPFADISEMNARDSFFKLRGVKWADIVQTNEWFVRGIDESNYSLMFDDTHMYLRRINTGNAASNRFHQQNRWKVKHDRYPSPVNTWCRKSSMISLMGAVYSLKIPSLNKNTLRTMIGMRKYISSQFKPNVAKALYDKFKAKRVLDFSMGWGDRLAGFYASTVTEHYVGLDPKKDNHPIYDEQVLFYDKHLSFFDNKKRTTFYAEPAEDFDYSEYHDYFDLVFTSPPYFSIERYSDEDTQSWVRYRTPDEWNTQFLHKALERVIPTVKVGGILAINISDVYVGGDKYVSITNPMNDFLSNAGLKYKGAIGMEMASRPNYNAKEDKRVFCEPIWIWERV